MKQSVEIKTSLNPKKQKEKRNKWTEKWLRTQSKIQDEIIKFNRIRTRSDYRKSKQTTYPKPWVRNGYFPWRMMILSELFKILGKVWGTAERERGREKSEYLFESYWKSRKNSLFIPYID